MCESSPCPKNDNNMDFVEEEDTEAREEYVLHQAKINQDIQVNELTVYDTMIN